MLYISFGFYGAIHEEYLFSEKIQAWKYGPVIPDVYHDHKSGVFASNAYFRNITAKEKKVIDHVLSFYGQKAPFLLVELTHQTNTPWSKYYVKGENIDIAKDDIIAYYKDFLKKTNALVNIMSTDNFKDIMESLSKT